MASRPSADESANAWLAPLDLELDTPYGTPAIEETPRLRGLGKGVRGTGEALMRQAENDRLRLARENVAAGGDDLENAAGSAGSALEVGALSTTGRVAEQELDQKHSDQ